MMSAFDKTVAVGISDGGNYQRPRLSRSGVPNSRARRESRATGFTRCSPPRATRPSQQYRRR